MYGNLGGGWCIIKNNFERDDERRIIMKGRKLYKSRSDKKICGVCGGVAEFFDIDPTIVRLITVGLCCLAGSGILIYIVAAIIMPDKPDDIIDA